MNGSAPGFGAVAINGTGHSGRNWLHDRLLASSEGPNARALGWHPTRNLD